MDHKNDDFLKYTIGTKRHAIGRKENPKPVRSRNFYLLNDTLYHKGADDIWWHTVRQYDKETVLREANCGIIGGHYA